MLHGEAGRSIRSPSVCVCVCVRLQCVGGCEVLGVRRRMVRCAWSGNKQAAGSACDSVPRPVSYKPCRLTASQCPTQPGLVLRFLLTSFPERGPPRFLTDGRMSMTKSGLACVYSV